MNNSATVLWVLKPIQAFSTLSVKIAVTFEVTMLCLKQFGHKSTRAIVTGSLACVYLSPISLLPNINRTVYSA